MTLRGVGEGKKENVNTLNRSRGRGMLSRDDSENNQEKCDLSSLEHTKRNEKCDAREGKKFGSVSWERHTIINKCNDTNLVLEVCFTVVVKV
jgi:hypothetical protein